MPHLFADRHNQPTEASQSRGFGPTSMRGSSRQRRLVEAIDRELTGCVAGGEERELACRVIASVLLAEN